MSKTLIFGIVLSLVVAGGFFVRAKADCGSQCPISKDMDKGSVNKQESKPNTPDPGPAAQVQH